MKQEQKKMDELKPIAFGMIAGGVMLFGAGLLFQNREWPDMFYGTISGPVLAGVGVVLLVFSLAKAKK